MILPFLTIAATGMLAQEMIENGARAPQWIVLAMLCLVELWLLWRDFHYA